MKCLTRLLIPLFACNVLALTAFAATVSESWNGGTGTWNTIGDWTPATVPNNGGGNVYAVTIDSGGTDTVTLDISPTIASLVLEWYQYFSYISSNGAVWRSCTNPDFGASTSSRGTGFFLGAASRGRNWDR